MPAGPSILWAEDDVRDQLLIKAALEGVAKPPRIEFANDGELLLEALKRTKPGLVVLDLRMPRLDGLGTLRRLRAQEATRKVPVIIFSSGNVPEEVAACRALGVNDVLQKPVDFPAFQAVVHRIVSTAAKLPKA